MSKIITFDKKEFKINNIKFTLNWENNVLTEEKSSDYLLENNISLPLDYIAFPWAFLIDIYCNRFKHFFSDFYFFIKTLGLTEKLDPGKKYITTSQSYHTLENTILDTFKKLNIKYLFCPHARELEFLKNFYLNDLLILPYMIYPSITGNEVEKTIFYSFIGNINYKPVRPTKIRNDICKMKHSDNCYIKSIDKWHFDDAIYGKQLGLVKYDKNDDHQKTREKEYRDILAKSLFSLCPLGIGPNSIRFSESLVFNSIPISISDDLWLPFYLDVDWDNIRVNLEESKIDDIPKLSLSDSQIKKYQQHILDFSNQYLDTNKFGCQLVKFFEVKNKYTLLVPWYNITDKLRYQEIHICLQKNLDNEYINQIIFFYEVKNKSEIDYQKYNNPKIIIIPVITDKKRDINFNQMVEYCNQNLLNQICIISNNDIYFDFTLNNLKELDFIKNNYFVSLTRKNCDDYLDNNNNIWKPHSASQDSWVFRTPLKKMPENINLGWIQCDNIISESYYQLSYYVINPHHSINSWHLHKFNNTNNLLQNYNYSYKYKMLKIPLQSISEILLNKNKKLDLSRNEKKHFIPSNRLNLSKFDKLKKKMTNNF